MANQEQLSRPAPGPVGRQALKAERRAQLLDAAKRLFATHGFHAVSLGDLGSGAGISAPAVYRHFASKEAVLAELLVGISERLSDGGAQVAAMPREAGAPREPDTATGAHDAALLGRLVDFHLDFAISEPELIRIQDRDFSALPADAKATVRRLQRRYIGLWSRVLMGSPGLTAEEAEIRVRSVFGLMNSTPHLGSRLSAQTSRAQLRVAALAALGAR